MIDWSGMCLCVCVVCVFVCLLVWLVGWLVGWLAAWLCSSMFVLLCVGSIVLVYYGVVCLFV